MRSLALAALLLIAGPARAAYELGPDSKPQAGVPKGTLTKLTWKSTKVYPGTERDLWVYAPPTTDPARPPGLMVVQDGWSYANPEGSFRMPVVLDNLIHRKE